MALKERTIWGLAHLYVFCKGGDGAVGGHSFSLPGCPDLSRLPYSNSHRPFQREKGAEVSRTLLLLAQGSMP